MFGVWGGWGVGNGVTAVVLGTSAMAPTMRLCAGSTRSDMTDCPMDNVPTAPEATNDADDIDSSCIATVRSLGLPLAASSGTATISGLQP